MPDENRITDLLYEILIHTHRGSIYEVAEISGYAYRTIYDYTTDHRKTAPVEVLKAAWLVTKDPRLKRLLEPNGYKLVRDDNQIVALRCPESEITDVIIAAGSAIQKLRAYLKDGVYSKAERISMMMEIDTIENEIAEARAAVKNITVA